ncbi:MAG: hypothetical protein LBC51_04650 [Treponema sp.]|jgi:hypothetical protein|nr:hypothetical protein [Treponema sp.]
MPEAAGNRIPKRESRGIVKKSMRKPLPMATGFERLETLVSMSGTVKGEITSMVKEPYPSSELAARQRDRNTNHKIIDRQFTTEDARIKIRGLYPEF